MIFYGKDVQNLEDFQSSLQIKKKLLVFFKNNHLHSHVEIFIFSYRVVFSKVRGFFARQNSQHTLAQVYGMSSFSSPTFFSTFASGYFSDFPPELCGED